MASNDDPIGKAYQEALETIAIAAYKNNTLPQFVENMVMCLCATTRLSNDPPKALALLRRMISEYCDEVESMLKEGEGADEADRA